MRNFYLSALMLIVALTFLQRHAQAQQGTPNAEQVQTKNKELREKAFAVLESLAGQLNTLQSAENRARIGANIAESLWRRDEPRARALFLQVQDEIKANLTIPDFENRDEIQRFLVFLKLRSDTLERITKYDAEMAYTFFEATPVDFDKAPHYIFENERSIDIRLSHKLAAKNPEVAVRLARKSLERGYSGQLLNVLGRLSGRHKEQALILYKDMVEKIRRSNLMDSSWEERQFIASLARNFRPPQIDELAYREFAGVIISTAAANGCETKSEHDEGTEFCYWTASVLTSFEKIDGRVARLKRWRPEFEEPEEPPPMSQGRMEFIQLLEEGAADDFLELAGKYPDLAPEILQQAMDRARREGDLDLMRKIAADSIVSPEMRESLNEQVRLAERVETFGEEQWAAVQAELNGTPQLQKRIWILAGAAYSAGGNNRKMALKLLTQASQIIETMNPGKEQTENQIQLAMLYCLEKDDRGFAIMESLVPKLNSLVEAAVKLDGYDTSYVRDGEWNMSAGGSLGELLTRLSQGSQLFAWCDFDRAMSLAAQFDRAEIRMMAQLKLAQSILAGPHKRPLIH